MSFPVLSDPSSVNPTLVERLRDERIFLTGATGFLGQAVLEKLVRETPVGQPVYLLVRPRKGESGADRIHRDVLGSTVFDRLRATRGADFDRLEERLIPVEGDLTLDRLGLDPDRWAEVAEAVTSVVHCAAACAFDQPLDEAVRTNTLGPVGLLRLAADAGDVPLVHVSTAYVNGERTDRLEEAVLPRGHTVRTLMEGDVPSGAGPRERAERLLEAAERARREAGPDEGDRVVREMGVEEARRHGWWNAYTFTKALGEQLIREEHGRVPVAILRPSIIEGAYREPVPGWIDRPRVSAFLAEVGQGRLPALPGRPGAALDVVPVDLAANAVLAALPVPDAGGGLTVYHVASGPDHTVPLEALASWLGEAARDNPIRDDRGEPVEPSELELVAPDRLDGLLRRREERARRRRDEAQTEQRSADARTAALEARLLARLRAMLRMYAPFVGPAPRLDRSNLEALARSLPPSDREAFPFDASVVDWRRYLRECEMPGVYRTLGKGPTASSAFRERLETVVREADGLGGLLESVARLFGDHPVVLENDGPAPVVLRWRDLAARVERIRRELAAAGLEGGAAVLVLGRPGADALAAWLASARAGLSPVWHAPTPSRDPEEALARSGAAAALLLPEGPDRSTLRVERAASVAAGAGSGEEGGAALPDVGRGGTGDGWDSEAAALELLLTAVAAGDREPVSLHCVPRRGREGAETPEPDLARLLAEALQGTTLAFVEP